MPELLRGLLDALIARPALAAGLGGSVMLLLLVWGVVSSSYRYR